MTRVLRAMLEAFAYFTTLPVARFVGLEAPNAFALTFLPFVGIVVGATAGCAGVLAMYAHAGHEFARAATFLTLVLVTGAIHLDGFLDGCDALFASVSPQRRLEIFKDVRHGTYAVVGMVVVLWLWWAALSRYEMTWTFVLVMAFACATARLAACANAWAFPYARAGAVTRQFETRPSLVAYAVFALACAAIGYAIAPVDAILVPAAVVVGLLFGTWMSAKLDGGLTGDCYGFIVVVIEVLLLLALRP